MVSGLPRKLCRLKGMSPRVAGEGGHRPRVVRCAPPSRGPLPPGQSHPQTHALVVVRLPDKPLHEGSVRKGGSMGLPRESGSRSRWSSVHTPRPHVRKSLAAGATDPTKPTVASPGDTSQETITPGFEYRRYPPADGPRLWALLVPLLGGGGGVSVLVRWSRQMGAFASAVHRPAPRVRRHAGPPFVGGTHTATGWAAAASQHSAQ